MIASYSVPVAEAIENIKKCYFPFPVFQSSTSSRLGHRLRVGRLWVLRIRHSKLSKVSSTLWYLIGDWYQFLTPYNSTYSTRKSLRRSQVTGEFTVYGGHLLDKASTPSSFYALRSLDMKKPCIYNYMHVGMYNNLASSLCFRLDLMILPWRRSWMLQTPPLD